MVRVKICGITTVEAALAAADAGVQALGFVFAASPRRIEPTDARRIVDQLPPFVSKVGVFVNAGRREVEEIAAYCRLDVLQFHGDETPEDCQGWRQPVIKAFRVGNGLKGEELANYRVAAHLLDSFVPGRRGGTGASFNWDLARLAKRFGPVILAGGIDAGNLEQAVMMASPYAVDVSSGVEANGRKDIQKIRALMAAAGRI